MTNTAIVKSRRCLNLEHELLLSGLSDKPSELVASGLVRARLYERMSGLVEPDQSHAYFTTGLFSIIDAVLDTPMEQLVASLPLAPNITEARRSLAAANPQRASDNGTFR